MNAPVRGDRRRAYALGPTASSAAYYHPGQMSAVHRNKDPANVTKTANRRAILFISPTPKREPRVTAARPT